MGAFMLSFDLLYFGTSFIMKCKSYHVLELWSLQLGEALEPAEKIVTLNHC